MGVDKMPYMVDVSVVDVSVVDVSVVDASTQCPLRWTPLQHPYPTFFWALTT